MKQNSKSELNQDAMQILFPVAGAYSRRRGVFILPEGAALIKALSTGQAALDDAAECARLRVELACAELWPYVRELFEADFFPHLLAAAFDILRALDFSAAEDITARKLANELTDAMLALEKTLCEAAPAMARAAEPEEK